MTGFGPSPLYCYIIATWKNENKALYFMICENTVYMHGIWRNCGRDNESIIQKLIENVCHNKAFEEYNRVNSNYLVIKKNQGYKQFANIMESYSSALCLRVKLQYHISYNQ